jgi:hypothetical protein
MAAPEEIGTQMRKLELHVVDGRLFGNGHIELRKTR